MISPINRHENGYQERLRNLSAVTQPAAGRARETTQTTMEWRDCRRLSFRVVLTWRGPWQVSHGGAPGWSHVAGPPGWSHMAGPPGWSHMAGPPGWSHVAGPPGCSTVLSKPTSCAECAQSPSTPLCPPPRPHCIPALPPLDIATAS